jgi:hypothetical protein
MPKLTVAFVTDLAERAARTFAQGYFTVWLTFKGADYDTLFTTDNLKAGVVACALSVAMSVGARATGSPDSASLAK